MKYACFPVLRHFKEENSGKCALIFDGYVGHSKRHINQLLRFRRGILLPFPHEKEEDERNPSLELCPGPGLRPAHA
jgi:hypothetical protein